MNYEVAKLYKQELEEKNKIDSERLQEFEKSAIGTTPDHIRELTEWKHAKQNFDQSFSELRNFNSWYVKTFRKEIQTDRRNRYSKTV